MEMKYRYIQGENTWLVTFEDYPGHPQPRASMSGNWNEIYSKFTAG